MSNSKAIDDYCKSLGVDPRKIFERHPKDRPIPKPDKEEVFKRFWNLGLTQRGPWVGFDGK